MNQPQKCDHCPEPATQTCRFDEKPAEIVYLCSGPECDFAGSYGHRPLPHVAERLAADAGKQLVAQHTEGEAR